MRGRTPGIAAYPFPGALAALKAVAKGKGSTLPDGTFVLPDPKHPQSVRLAAPGDDYEIEVFDPDPKVALELARSGRVRPVF